MHKCQLLVDVNPRLVSRAAVKFLQFTISIYVKDIFGCFLVYINKILDINKNPTRCNSMQIFIYCKVTLHVSGVTAPIIRSTKNCNRNLRYRS